MRIPHPLPLIALLFGAAAAASGTAVPTAHTGDAAPLVDPQRPVTRIARDGFTLQYYTRVPCESRVEVREGPLPRVAWRPAGMQAPSLEARVVSGPPGKRSLHVVRVSGLRPGRRYFTRVFDPEADPTPQERAWGAARPWRREFAVSTLSAPGMKTVIHLPVKVLLMPNVANIASAHQGGTVAPLPPLMTADEMAKIRAEYAHTARFFWVNSGMRLWVDFQIQVDDRRQRWGPEPEGVAPEYRGWPVCRSYGGQDFRGPGGGEFTILDTKKPLEPRSEPVYEERPFSSQVEQAFPRRWNPTARRWEFYISGGGTFGVDGFPRGVPARSQYLGGGDTAWLACHEVHHQLESHGAFSLGNREDERVVFNHYEPRRRVLRPDGSAEEAAWSTSGRHGEHWDGMAYWDRTLSDAQWLRFYFGATISVADFDSDGFPDRDPRLPLDEQRFGSSPSKARTDGGMRDLDKAMLSTWVPSCLQFSLTKPPFQGIRPSAARADTDGDGEPDAEDAYPLYPWKPFVWPLRAEVDGSAREWEHVPLAGEAKEGGMEITFRHAHDDTAYYGLFTLRGPWRRLYATFDGEGEGYFSGVGVQGFELLAGEAPTVRPLRMPFIEKAAPGLKWKAARRPDGAVDLEFSFPNRGEGLWFWDRAGREIGVSVDLFDAKGTGYSLYEPYRHFYCRMIEPAGKPPFPPGAPAELTAEQADAVLLPGDARLRLQGPGWRRDGALLRHSGGDEAAAYVDGLAAREFDLWVRFEAKQDGILGGFLPGTNPMSAGRDYVLFVGGYGNTVTRMRLFGREEGDGEVRMTPGIHTMQLTRRGGSVWCLFDGKPILWAADPRPGEVVNRLAFLGGYGGEQALHEMRVRASR